MKRVSVYRNARDKLGVITTMAGVINRIISGDKGLIEKTRQANLLASDPAQAEVYREFKATMIAVAWAGIFKKRGNAGLEKHSGYLVLDIDHAEPSGIMADLHERQDFRLAFVSPSAMGVKIVVKLSPIPKTLAEHKAAWAQACEQFSDLGVEFDPQGSEVSRLCFLAYDPQAIIREDPMPVEWDPEDATEWAEIGEPVEVTLTMDSEKFIRENGIRFDVEGKSQYLPKSFCQKTDHTSNNNAVRYFKDRDGAVRGFCHGCQGKWVLQEPKRVMDAQFNPNYDIKEANLMEERENVKNRLADWLEDTDESENEILNLTTAAGTGKSTTTILMLSGDYEQDAKNLLYVGKTTEEADQAFNICKDTDSVIAHRHRSRMHNFDPDNPNAWSNMEFGLGENDRPCIHPVECNTLAQKGHPAMLQCDRCHIKERCNAEGYLFQYQVEARSTHVFTAWNEDLFADEAHLGRVSKIAGPDKIIVADEASPGNLPMERVYSQKSVAEHLRRFMFPDFAEFLMFATELNLAIENAKTPQEFHAALQPLLHCSEDVIEKYDEYAVTFPVQCIPYDHENVTLVLDLHGISTQIVQENVPADYFFAEDEPFTPEVLYVKPKSVWWLLEYEFLKIEEVPRAFPRLFSNLKTFAPIETDSPACHRVDDVWYYYLPPGLNAKRGVILSASDDANLIKEVYAGTGINVRTVDGNPPAWKPGCELHQIATGRYTMKQTLLSGEGKLKPKAIEMVAFMAEKIAEAPKKFYLVVAQTQLHDLLSAELYKRVPGAVNVTFINHHHAEGRNDYQYNDIVFVFHYEPNHSDIMQQASRIFRNKPDLSFERAEKTIEKGGVKITRMRYVDPDVDAVYDRECEKRHMQSILRLRQHINPNKIAYLFSAEPVSGLPIVPIPFSLKKPLKPARTIRTEQRRDKDTKEQEQHDLSREVIRLSDEGLRQNEIVSVLRAKGYQISQSKVSRILSHHF